MSFVGEGSNTDRGQRRGGGRGSFSGFIKHDNDFQGQSFDQKGYARGPRMNRMMYEYIVFSCD